MTFPRPRVGTHRRWASRTWVLRVLAGTLAVLLVPLSPLPAAQAATVLKAVRVIGGPGHAGLYGWGVEAIPPGQPRAGNVLVTDYWNLRIAEYDQQGNLVGHPVQNDGLHTAPYDVAINPVNGNIAFGDVDSGMQVDIYSAGGTYLRSCGNGQRWTYPAWLDYDATGRLAVADSRGHKIVVINDANCAIRFQFGTRGTGLSQFQTPRGVDFAEDGTLWVNDNNNQRVVQWQLGATSATALRAIPVAGGDLRGLLVRNGELYVVNAGRSLIDVYDIASGTRVRGWGGFGPGNGRFIDGGRGIAADGSGNVWVGDMPSFRAQKFSPQGTFLLAAPAVPEPPPVGGYAMPEGVAAFPDGTVAGLDTFNWRVNVHPGNGSAATAFGTRTVFNYPRGLAADRDEGTLVVGNTDSAQVDKYTRSGQKLWSAEGVKPWAVAVDQDDGTIYASEFIANRVRVIDADGSLGPTMSGGLSNPRGIAVDPVDGSVWVSNQGNGRIVHFAADGDLLGSFDAGAVKLADVEVNADTVFLADKQANLIRMYTKAGTPTGNFGGGGTALGRFRSPAGLDLMGDRLYVMEMRGERIQELRISVNRSGRTR